MLAFVNSCGGRGNRVDLHHFVSHFIHQTTATYKFKIGVVVIEKQTFR